jgi:hypothetical protein
MAKLHVGRLAFSQLVGSAGRDTIEQSREFSGSKKLLRRKYAWSDIEHEMFPAEIIVAGTLYSVETDFFADATKTTDTDRIRGRASKYELYC